MAETVVWNKKLLVASLILAGFAAAMFYLYDSAQKAKLRGDVVQILQWKRDLASGEEISEADIAVINTNTSAMNVKDILRKKNKPLVTGGKYVSRPVRRGDPVYYKDILGGTTGTPADDISKGMRGFTLRVDPNYTPGDMLRVGGRVDVLGMVRLKGKPAKTFTLVQNLRVLAVGGKGQKPEESFGRKRGRGYDPGMRVYRSVTVEVSPTLAEQLIDLMPRIMGKVCLTVRNPADAPKPDDFRGPNPKCFKGINPKIVSILSQPLPGKITGNQ